MRKHPVLSIGPVNSRGFHSNKNNSRMSQTCDKFNDITCLDPNWVSGFADGGGYFFLRIRKNSKSNLGWSVELGFGIHLHKKDKALLQAIKNLLQGIGHITNNGQNAVQFQVSSVKDLKILISHFDKYPLITKKLGDYLLFKQAFNLISCKEHLTTDGLNKLVAIKSSMNKGLSTELQQAFSQVKPNLRPDVNKKYIINPYWLAGFISEGCFFIHIEKVVNKEAKPNGKIEKVRLKFKISQHIRDAA